LETKKNYNLIQIVVDISMDREELMKRSFCLACIILFSFLSIPSLSQGMEKPPVGQVEENQGQINPSWVAIGVRAKYFRLTDANRKIVGNMITLDEDQSYYPISPLIQVNLSKYVAVELSVDWFKANTLNNDYLKWASDGDLDWTTYMLGLQFRWPHFHRSFVPYVSGGVSYNKTNWNRKDWYYYGFPSPGEYTTWTSQGYKPEDFPNNGYRRIHSVDDAYGVYLGLGADYFLTKSWAVNFDWRYHWAQVNWTYQLINNDGPLRAPEQGTAVLNSWILGLGVKYFF
jgi:hypothetical protein